MPLLLHALHLQQQAVGGGQRGALWVLLRRGVSPDGVGHQEAMPVLPPAGSDSAMRQETLRGVDAFPVWSRKGSNLPVQWQDDDLL